MTKKLLLEFWILVIPACRQAGELIWNLVLVICCLPPFLQEGRLDAPCAEAQGYGTPWNLQG